MHGVAHGHLFVCCDGTAWYNTTNTRTCTDDYGIDIMCDLVAAVAVAVVVVVVAVAVAAAAAVAVAVAAVAAMVLTRVWVCMYVYTTNKSITESSSTSYPLSHGISYHTPFYLSCTHQTCQNYPTFPASLKPRRAAGMRGVAIQVAIAQKQHTQKKTPLPPIRGGANC